MADKRLTDYDGFGHWLLIEWEDASSDWWIGGRKDSAGEECANMYNVASGENRVINFDQIKCIGEKVKYGK